MIFLSGSLLGPSIIRYTIFLGLVIITQPRPISPSSSSVLAQQPQKKAKSSNLWEPKITTMAKTLMVRPYVFAASSQAARNLFLRQAQPTRPFVSAVLFNRARTSCTKLQTHSNSKNSVGEEYSCGNSLGFWFVPASGRRVSTRATNVNDAGSIDSPLMHSMEKKIKEHLNAESVTVRDAYGDGRHVSIDVISSTFEGQSAVNRQRMVYKAIWEELQTTVHAVDQMTTRTPTEASAEK